MMKIRLIVMDKCRQSFYLQAAAEYQKRLSRYCRLEVTELNPVRLADRPSLQQVEAALQKEAELIRKVLPEQTVPVVLCVEGKQQTSEQFSRWLCRQRNFGGGDVSFVIGSSHGLADSVKEAAAQKLSFSQMTFPHELARVVLLEQIYRAFKIDEGSPYHK